MLGQIDTFLAFGAVMLVVSMLVTAITQLISAMLNSRGRQLFHGLERLLHHAAPALGVQAKAMVDEILRHPLVAQSALSKDGRAKRAAGAIRKRELTILLDDDRLWAEAARQWAKLELGRGEPQAAMAIAQVPVETWLTWWRELQHYAGHSNNLAAQAGDLLWRATGEQGLEKKVKQMGADLAAFLGAERERQKLIEDVETWFDSVMDRASQRFTANMRVVTLGIGVVLAFVMQLDAFALMQRFSDDPVLRTQVLEQVARLDRDRDRLAPSPGVQAKSADPSSAPEKSADPPSAPNQPAIHSAVPESETLASVDGQLESVNELTATLKSMGFQLLPSKLGWPVPGQIPGILASIVLLSLGAPFWFNVLRQLSNLRPIVANLEKKEREDNAAAKNQA